MIGDLLNMLRVNNIFGSSNSQSQSPMMNQNQNQNQPPNQMNSNNSAGDDDQAIISRIQSMFNPSHGAQDRLRSILDTAPQHSQYEPGKLTKLLGGLASLSTVGPAGIENGSAVGFRNYNPAEGRKIQDSIVNDKYNNAVDDWSMKLKPVQELATAERGSNSNERIMANDVISRTLQNKNIERQATKDKNDNAIKEGQLKEKNAFLDYLKYKRDHPNHVYKADKDGHVYSIDPHTNTTEYITDSNGDLISSDKMPEMEKLKIQNVNRLGQISAQGNESRKTVDEREKGTSANIVTRGTEARKTKETVPGKAPSSAPDKTAKRVGLQDPTGKTFSLPETQLAAYLKLHPDWKVIK